MNYLEKYRELIQDGHSLDLLVWRAFGNVEGILDSNSSTDKYKIEQIKNIVVAFNTVLDQKWSSKL